MNSRSRWLRTRRDQFIADEFVHRTGRGDIVFGISVVGAMRAGEKDWLLASLGNVLSQTGLSG
jgi:hypothetical protein